MFHFSFYYIYKTYFTLYFSAFFTLDVFIIIIFFSNLKKTDIITSITTILSSYCVL